jgi:hypothetical protein
MSDPRTITWGGLERLRWHAVRDLSAADLPRAPGVYIWRRLGEIVYIGEAKTGLRNRLRAHLSTRPDLSRSTLRASVAVIALGIDRKVARSRPTLLEQAEVDVVNAWLRECDLAWVICSDGAEAHALEMRLRAERLPPLNRM